MNRFPAYLIITGVRRLLKAVYSISMEIKINEMLSSEDASLKKASAKSHEKILALNMSQW